MEVLDRLNMIDSSSSEEIYKQALKDEEWLTAVPEGLNGEGMGGATNGHSARSQSSTLDSDDERIPNGGSGGRKRRRRKKRKNLAGAVNDFLVKGSGPALEGAQPPRHHPETNGNSMERGELIEDSAESYDEDTLDIQLDEQELRELASFGASMSSYMASMDRELAHTAMGASFTKKASTAAARSKTDRLKVDATRHGTKSPGADSIDMEDDEFRAVDIDSNLVQNILTGFCAEQKQGGGAATALLRSLSIREGREPPPLDSDDDEYEPGI